VIVSEIDTLDGKRLDERKFLQIAASIEKYSEHPLAQAIVEEAKNKELELLPAEHFLAVPGRGIEAFIDSRKYLAGNLMLMRESKVETGNMTEQADALANQGKTPLYFADREKVLGIIAVADTIKPTSKAAVDIMRGMGLEVVLLTGEQQENPPKRSADSWQSIGPFPR
jgi:Cu+-exporting ATPase